MKNVLSIAGSDPSGGAGIQADLKTFAAQGVYGMAVITALTAQNTQGVDDVYVPPADFTVKQIMSVLSDVRVDAIKIGMLPTAEIMECVAWCITRYPDIPIVLDPVMVATSGDQLMDDDAVSTMKNVLCPIASIITPNMHEAAILLGREIDNSTQDARDLLTLPCRAALLKGGHGIGGRCVDIFVDSKNIKKFEAQRIDTKNTHGTGCTLSSAITAQLSLGRDMTVAIQCAKDYITQAILQADNLDVGQGHGPVNHHVRI